MGEGCAGLCFQEGALCGEEGAGDTRGKSVNESREGKRREVAKRREEIGGASEGSKAQGVVTLGGGVLWGGRRGG